MREAELWELQRLGGRRSSVPPSSASEVGVSGHHPLSSSQHQLRMVANAEDLHAWSIYRQVNMGLKGKNRRKKRTVEIVSEEQKDKCMQKSYFLFYIKDEIEGVCLYLMLIYRCLN